VCRSSDGTSVLLADLRSRAAAPWQSGGRGGCRNPNADRVTGTSADADRCVVVQLQLRDNNLVGTMGEELGQLDHLQRLDLSSNSLHGSMPSFFAERRWQRISITGNGFSWISTHSTDPCAACSHGGEMSPIAAALVRQCSAGSMGCDGLPPYSCDAFSSGQCTECFFVVDRLNPTTCVRCDSSSFWRLFYIISVPTMVLMAVAGYAYLMVRKPELLKGTITTISILFSHLQTVLICSQLQLRWPKTVSTALDVIGFDMLNIDIGRPECLIGGVDESLGGSWFLFSAAQLGVLALLFTMILFASQLERLRLRCQLSHYKRKDGAAERERSAMREAHQQECTTADANEQPISRRGARTRLRRARRTHHAHKKSQFRIDQLELIETVLFGYLQTGSNSQPGSGLARHR
jgi:hypothetical protein